MGLKYNDKTGEFFEEENAPRQMRRQSVSRNVPHRHAKIQAPGNVRRVLAHAPRTLANLAVFVKLLKWPFYPFIKWWEVEKDAFHGGDWFFLIVWCIPLLLLVGLYRLVFRWRVCSCEMVMFTP